MKIIAFLILFVSSIQPSKFEAIHTFKDKEGNILGYLQGIKKHEDFYSNFRIVGLNDDILYSVDENRLYSGSDLDLEITAGGEFYGYKIVMKKDDYMVISYYSNNGQNVADDITIEYDYMHKTFERLILP